MVDDIILGVANTAPFSPWSYGTYLAKTLPILLIAILFFVSFLSSNKNEKVNILVNATPVKMFQFKLLRYVAIFLVSILISFVPVGFAIWFYCTMFQFTNISSLILPTIIVFIPAMIFTLGTGLFIAKIKPILIYLLIPCILIFCFLRLPYSIDVFSINFLSTYPITLSTIDPPFIVPASVVLGKTITFLIGLILVGGVAIKRK